MALRNKVFIPDAIYFITFTIIGWKYVFINDRYCNLVYKWFNYMKDKYDNKIYGYVIMPNHIHSIIEITNKSPKQSTLIQNAKRFLAYEIVALLKEDSNATSGMLCDKTKTLLRYFQSLARTSEGAKHKVFEDNYDSKIVQSRKFFLQKLNYIHNNPCQEKWQLVDKPENYKHSSAANYILDNGLYKVDIMEF